ncbi:MAG: Peroxisome chaperone and import receptor [Icmadophila ericetorum]|nr:Peroxisome chaperone and import receptor [Icmadophila ericetorum]
MDSKPDTSHGAGPATKDPTPEGAEEFPDPEEDDLDDLDDILDEFSTTKIDQKTDAPHASGPGRPFTTGKTAVNNEDLTEEFSKQLEEQMAALMGEIDQSPEMKAQIEGMMKELSVATDTTNVQVNKKDAAKKDIPSKAGGPSTTSTAEESFQETIRKTMERMQASTSTATTSAPSDSEADLLAQMLKDMQSAGLDPSDGGGEEDFSKMLLGMMEQLTNKEILYDPMKELHDKFPGWMEKNRGKCVEADMKRYVEQQRLVGEIVARFERKGYSDGNAEDREFIVERMQKMQAEGSPPADLVGDMNAAQEALGDIDAGCPQQ